MTGNETRTADVLIVGGGSAEAVLAARVADPGYDWGYGARGGEHSPQIPTPRGRTLGGSSAMRVNGAGAQR